MRAAALLALATLLLAACAAPAKRLDGLAEGLGFGRYEMRGTDYIHTIYRNAAEGRLLHVYLEGDGTPWLTRTLVAADPTPRNPLVLRLMAQDPAPSLYLGRPCYHGDARNPPCSPYLWTSQRYSAEVVDSMAAVLAGVLRSETYEGLVFIGHSGGGALAMLLAERFAGTRAVVTLAGNLDPAAWTAWHNYSPLEGSLNPALRPPLDPRIRQLHYVGGRDKNIPLYIAERVVSRQANATLILMKTFDHVCCWESAWPSILARVQSELSGTDKSDRDFYCPPG